MIWTKELADRARQMGWGIYDVWDGKSWSCAVLPVQGFPKSTPNAHAVLAYVRGNAAAGDPLCRAALKHLSEMSKACRTK